MLVTEAARLEMPKGAKEVGAEVVGESWLVARVRASKSRANTDLTPNGPVPSKKRRRTIPSGKERTGRWNASSKNSAGEVRAGRKRKITKARKCLLRLFLVNDVCRPQGTGSTGLWARGCFC